MTKPGGNFLKAILVIIGIIVVSFYILLYDAFEQQKKEINAMSDQQKVDTQVSSNKFKYQEQQIYILGRDLHDSQQQIKEQKDAFLQEVEKRQQIEGQSKSIQSSLVDIKAEADAIKQDMKGWQKDYVSVLAQLEKKMDDSQDEMKNVENDLADLNIPQLKENINSLKADIEKINHPVDNDTNSTPPAPEKKIERTEFKSE